MRKLFLVILCCLSTFTASYAISWNTVPTPGCTTAIMNVKEMNNTLYYSSEKTFYVMDANGSNTFTVTLPDQVKAIHLAPNGVYVITPTTAYRYVDNGSMTPVYTTDEYAIRTSSVVRN